MKYIKGKYYVEKVEANKIAKIYGTPSYCYSENKLKKNIRNFKNNFKSIDPLICFSIKSNNNLQIVKIIKNAGLGADVVSKGELMFALKAGISPSKIVFSGVGKTSEEIKYAIEKNILLINAESENEIKIIEKVALSKKKNVKIGLRLNPNIDALTNSKISTGRKIDKFGVDKKNFVKIIEKFKSSKNLTISCLSVHIGSQISNFTPFGKMIKEVSKILSEIKHKFEYVDFGGGMSIQYEKNDPKLNYKKYSSAIVSFLKKNDVKVIFEPGRAIIGNAAVLLTKIIYVKKTKNINFIIIDAAMNDLIRPALYGSTHQIIPIKINKGKVKKVHNFVGPICETSDQFLRTMKFSTLFENDILAICDVGAYGMVLSSNYNLRAKPPEIIVNNSKIKLATRRQKIKNII